MNRNLLKEIVIDQRLSENTKSYVKRYEFFSSGNELIPLR
jgi:hypothetical protein